jgi:hypothetical protein
MPNAVHAPWLLKGHKAAAAGAVPVALAACLPGSARAAWLWRLARSTRRPRCACIAWTPCAGDAGTARAAVGLLSRSSLPDGLQWNEQQRQAVLQPHGASVVHRSPIAVRWQCPLRHVIKVSRQPEDWLPAARQRDLRLRAACAAAWKLAPVAGACCHACHRITQLRSSPCHALLSVTGAFLPPPCACTPQCSVRCVRANVWLAAPAPGRARPAG